MQGVSMSIVISDCTDPLSRNSSTYVKPQRSDHLKAKAKYNLFLELFWRTRAVLDDSISGRSTRRKSSRPRRDRDETFVALET